jgi:N-acetylglucosamine kinase-like BadF-type ATPase
MHVLGIDAGGTKTVCLLADEDGGIVSAGRGPGANLHTAGELAVEKVLHEAMEAAIGDRAITPSAICLGIAGVDRDDEARTVRAIMRRIGYKSRVLVVNDALIGLVAGARDEPGIVINAGTDRSCTGATRLRGGARRRLGPHDRRRGSGYWIGRESLAAVMRAFDGRGPETRLTAEMLEHFNVEDESRLPRIVYDRAQPRVGVAALGPIVQRVRIKGDAVATRILERAADELVLAARSVATRLEMRGDAFTFYLAGGVFRVVPWLALELVRRLMEVAPRRSRKLLLEEPAVGAVWLALAEARGGAKVPQYKVAWLMADGRDAREDLRIRRRAGNRTGPRHRATADRGTCQRARPGDRPHADSAVSRARASAPAGAR